MIQKREIRATYVALKIIRFLGKWPVSRVVRCICFRVVKRYVFVKVNHIKIE
jgi:hypothetical protein